MEHLGEANRTFCCRCQIGPPTVVVDSRRKICIPNVVDIEMWGESYFDFFLGNSPWSAPVGGLFVAEAEHEVSSICRQDPSDLAREGDSVIVDKGVEQSGINSVV